MLESGDIYHSTALGSVGTRALREDEFHRRIRGLGLAFDAGVTWLQIPLSVEAEDGPNLYTTVVKEFPVVLPSSFAACCDFGRLCYVFG